MPRSCHALSQETARQRLTGAMRENYSPVPETGCWLWLGAWDAHKYGSAHSSDLWRDLAHRLFYAFHRGDIPAGMDVCHKCDTPACINPDHLFLGSHDQNMRDMKIKGRAREARGERNSSAKLTEADVIAIRASNETQRVLAERYGVCPASISHVKTGRCWRNTNG